MAILHGPHFMFISFSLCLNCAEKVEISASGKMITSHIITYSYDGIDNFTINTVDSWKLAAFLKMDEAFISDAGFDIENYLNRFAKNFGRAKDNAFINGTGIQMPIGILNATNGTDVGITTAQITHDNINSLPGRPDIVLPK